DVHVIAASQAPVAQGATFAVDEDRTLQGSAARLTSTDPRGLGLTFAIVQQPSHGVLTIVSPADGTFSYKPDQDYNGSDLFTFTSSDGIFTSLPATAQVTVRPINDTPVADTLAFNHLEDGGVLTGTLTASDPDFDDLTF